MSRKLSKIVLGFRDFATESQIKDVIRREMAKRGESVDLEKVEMLQLFDTSKQRTWLVSGPQRLFCVLDDVRTPAMELRWTEPRDKLMKGDQVTTQVEKRPKSELTGFVDIGAHTSWLYSKGLFRSSDVTEDIRGMLRRTMT